MGKPACFKAYDIRGRVPDELNAKLADAIGNAFAALEDARRVVVCRDIRQSSNEIADAVCAGLQAAGCDVLDIGVGGTEHVYFAVPHLQADGGIMVTASHNPADYNGMKLVRAESVPISGDSGLDEIGVRAASGRRTQGEREGTRSNVDVSEAYISHLLGYVADAALKPLKIVVNAGNGGAGLVIDQLEAHLPFEFIKVHHEPDGSFPNGVPNPLLTENRQPTIDAIAASSADFGVAWDGDFDRCFFFDHEGGFIEGYYIVGLLAQYFLERATQPGEKIIHDPRLTWNTREIVEQLGGVPVVSKTGHAFIKERMRKENALYGGEMSAHHYFRDFAYCDSGMIPWLLVAALVSTTGTTLHSQVTARQARYPASGEINRRIGDPAAVLAGIEKHFSASAVHVDHIDGLSMEFADWRFNLRSSNTEPLVRLNVESRGDEALMQAQTKQLLALLDTTG
ncbi:MAG: phosphomannomutase [Gammaproteobacteria bacterium]|nr:phosphomannomutase [Gammaproteobacteria bacterium]